MSAYTVGGVTVGPTLAKCLLTLLELGSARDWRAFALQGRYNGMRHLLAREWIVDRNAAARAAYLLEQSDAGLWPDEVPNPIEKFPPDWRLTDAGRAIAERLKPRR